MHDLFIDEAGTSGAPHEPFSIVAGVIIPTEKREAVQHAMNAVVFETVPPQFRDGFLFHAKDLMDSKNKKIREGWPLSRRLALIYTMMRIPAAYRLPVLWVAARNGCPFKGDLGLLSKADFIHITSFLHCIGTYNSYLEEADETGIVIVEDVPGRRTRLNNAFHVMRNQPFSARVNYSDSRPNAAPSMPSPIDIEFKISRIPDNPYFLRKGMIPWMQLADACAFGIRSFLAKAAHSEIYGRMILGNDEKILHYREHSGTYMGGIVEWTPRLNSSLSMSIV